MNTTYSSASSGSVPRTMPMTFGLSIMSCEVFVTIVSSTPSGVEAGVFDSVASRASTNEIGVPANSSVAAGVLRYMCPRSCGRWSAATPDASSHAMPGRVPMSFRVRCHGMSASLFLDSNLIMPIAPRAASSFFFTRVDA